MYVRSAYIAEYGSTSKVANLPYCQLNRDNRYSPVPIRAGELGLARHVQPSRPASACSLSTLKPNLVLANEISPLSEAASIYLSRQPSPGQSRVYQAT